MIRQLGTLCSSERKKNPLEQCADKLRFFMTNLEIFFKLFCVTFMILLIRTVANLYHKYIDYVIADL